MTLAINNWGGTLTEGATKELSFSGSPVAGKVSFVTNEHTRLAARQVDFTASNAVTTATNPGVARSGMKITFGDRQTAAGCCTVEAGNVIVDVGVRWSMNQPEALVDGALEALRALVFSTAFEQAVKRGILPN